MTDPRDHGGGLDAAIAIYGGTRADWLDLSTGINPVAYPISPFSHDAWTALPDAKAFDALSLAARNFWQVPDHLAILPAQGASALIAALPALTSSDRVYIPKPTYNEHAAAFAAHGIAEAGPDAQTHVYVHPNNPDGRLSTDAISARDLTVIDESFCDTTPDASLVPQIGDTNTLVLKSFGKFWGLAGLRLGFAIGPASLINPLRDRIGPWAVAGPALELGAIALRDAAWAERTRARLVADSVRLDACLQTSNAIPLGGTPLFRLFEVNDAKEWQQRLAQAHVWSRIFPYSKTWLRLGLPHPDRWSHLETAL